MNFKIVIKGLFFLLLVTISFTNCSQDSEEAPTPPPVVVPPKVDPSPSVANIPSIAPTVCDFELNQAYLDNLDDLGWTLEFEENFDGDFSKWNVWNGGAYNNELQHYQAANMELADGILTITAKKETVTGNTTPYNTAQKTFNYTSSRIETKTLFSANSTTPYVRFMARIKLPNGYGMWPAFWCYGDPWPTQGEIDFIEARGQETGKYHTNYFYGTAANVNLVSNASVTITADNDLSTCYHVYELIWEKNRLISLLDGKVVESKTSGGYIPSLFGTQEKMVLNLAIGGDFFGNLDPELIETKAMSIDWVKVYTAK